MPVPAWGSFSFLYGPVMAVIGIALLMVIAKWAMQSGHSLVARPGRPDEYGMLVPIATPADNAAGVRMAQRLGSHGIQATLARTLDGLRLLVWPADADRARELLGAEADPPDIGT